MVVRVDPHVGAHLSMALTASATLMDYFLRRGKEMTRLLILTFRNLLDMAGDNERDK